MKEIKKLFTLFGSSQRVSEILGLKSARQVRRVANGTAPMPNWYADKLREHSKERIKELEDQIQELVSFSENV